MSFGNQNRYQGPGSLSTGTSLVIPPPSLLILISKRYFFRHPVEKYLYDEKEQPTTKEKIEEKNCGTKKNNKSNKKNDWDQNTEKEMINEVEK